MSEFDPSLAFITCPRHCDVAAPPEALGRGRYLCTCCHYEFDSGIRPSVRDAGAPPRGKVAASVGSMLALLLVLAGCATGSPPTPQPPVAPQPPPSELITFEVFVHDLRTPSLGLSGVQITCGEDTRTSNPDGTAHFDVPTGRQLDCLFQHEAYDQQRASALPGVDARLSTWMHRIFAPRELQALHVEDNARWFAKADGSRFDYREISAFALVGMVQAGREGDVRHYLEQVAGLGFTVARVFLTYTGGDAPAGPDRPNFYQSLDRTIQIAAESGMYLRLTFIAATEPWGGVWFPDRRDIWKGPVRAGGEAFSLEVARHICGQPHVIGELANEPGQIGLRDSFDALIALGRQVKADCPSLLLGGGAVDGPNDQDTRFAVAPFDYVDAHIERRMDVGGFEWVKRSGEYALIDQEHVGKRMPFISGEPVNFGEWRRDGRNGDVERSPSVSLAYGAVSRARQYNTNFHYDGGLYTTLPNADTLESIRCYMAGLDAFPMSVGAKWRGHWGLGAGDYWKDSWPSVDGTREVEDHIRSGRGPWRAFGAGAYSVVFPEPDGWDWRANLDAPADVVASCSAGEFQASVYRRQ